MYQPTNQPTTGSIIILKKLKYKTVEIDKF